MNRSNRQSQERKTSIFKMTLYILPADENASSKQHRKDLQGFLLASPNRGGISVMQKYRKKKFKSEKKFRKVSSEEIHTRLCRVYSDPRAGMQYTLIFLYIFLCIRASSIIDKDISWLSPSLGTASQQLLQLPWYMSHLLEMPMLDKNFPRHKLVLTAVRSVRFPGKKYRC